MFRTARGFLLSAPAAFLLALIAFFLAHPKAAEAFTPYPFLTETIRLSFPKGLISRFAMTATLFFLVPYIVTGLLLFLADVGSSAAARLWSGKAGRRPSVYRESVITYVAVLGIFSIFSGLSMHKVAHGGELTGGVNVAPILIAIVPYAAVVAALLSAGLAAIPRGLFNLFEGMRTTTVRRTAG